MKRRDGGDRMEGGKDIHGAGQNNGNASGKVIFFFSRNPFEMNAVICLHQSFRVDEHDAATRSL